MSLADFRYGVSLRYTQDLRMRDKINTVLEKDKALRDCQAATLVLEETLANKDKDIAIMKDQFKRLNERANKSDRKAKKKPVLAYAVAGAGLALVLDGEPKNNPAGYALTGVGVGLIVLTF